MEHKKQLVVEITADEHNSIKLAATQARITIKRYVRLKLGLDSISKEKTK